MADLDRDELHRLWTASSLSTRAIAAYFHTTESTIAGMIHRAQKAEGLERWPKRSGAINPRETPRPPSRLKPGATTLPPLDSLR